MKIGYWTRYASVGRRAFDRNRFNGRCTISTGHSGLTDVFFSRLSFTFSDLKRPYPVIIRETLTFCTDGASNAGQRPRFRVLGSKTNVLPTRGIFSEENVPRPYGPGFHTRPTLVHRPPVALLSPDNVLFMPPWPGYHEPHSCSHVDIP